MEGAVSLQEYVTLQDGQITTVDAGMMLIFFKREDAGEHKLFRFSPQRAQPLLHHVNVGGINYNLQQAPPQPYPFNGQAPAAAVQPPQPNQQDQALHRDYQAAFQEVFRQMNEMGNMLRQQQQQQQQQNGTRRWQNVPPNVVRLDDTSMGLNSRCSNATEQTFDLDDDENAESMFRDL